MELIEITKEDFDLKLGDISSLQEKNQDTKYYKGDS